MKIITDTGDYTIYLDNIKTVYDGSTTKTFIFRGGSITLRDVYICFCDGESIETILSYFSGYGLYQKPSIEAPEDKKCKYVRLSLIKGEFK